jgi:DHA1 family bicyclomycin/chloramphenicol resistance-like MFS transporter
MQSGMFYVLAGILPYHYEALGQSPLAFGLWFSIMPIGFFIGNIINRRYLVMRGIEIVAFTGSLITLLSMIILCVAAYTGNLTPAAIALPCGLFGFGNGILISNATIGAISAAGKYAGTGSGFTGAWQMIAGAGFGALIVALGGTISMLVTVISIIGISIISIICLSYAFIHRNRLADK